MEQGGANKIGGDGNTKSSPPPREIQCRNWFFTLNNYTEEECGAMEQLVLECSKYMIGKEVGDNGTPHLQGILQFKIKRRLENLKKFNNRIHWEKCRNLEESIAYCSKESIWITNVKQKRTIKFPNMDKQWEIDILNIIKEEPDDRTIHWYWSKSGNVGKTTFCKYLTTYFDAITLPPKTADAFHCIAKLVEDDKDVNLCIFDIPRTSIEYINYSAIEKIKDGYFSSGKYEGCSVCIPCPHVLIFCNEPPITNKLSVDRWHIVEI